jgi:hypothetical protein
VLLFEPAVGSRREIRAGSGATWTRHAHTQGAVDFDILQSTPAELVLVRSSLEEAHRKLGAAKLVIGMPSRDTIIAADYERIVQLMVITTLRFTEVPAAEQLSPDLLVVEDGVIVALVLHTLLETELAAETTFERALRVGADGEFHLTAGTDLDALLDVVGQVVDFVAENWSADATFSGKSTMFVTAPEDLKVSFGAIRNYVTTVAKETGIERLRFRVEHVPRT